MGILEAHHPRSFLVRDPFNEEASGVKAVVRAGGEGTSGLFCGSMLESAIDTGWKSSSRIGTVWASSRQGTVVASESGTLAGYSVEASRLLANCV